ncbi:MAG: 23S rRNA (cytosine(1962)-C(5))-methyltransferase RlmI, partial [Anaerolineae bacterium]|nr:23S rRNA (cytosine(1962)-C(5))-methyltransferase RlmI [Anaerolineae bacterium]
MISTPRVYLKPGRDAPVQRRHPWVFSGGIGRITGDPEAGDLVAIHSADGKFLAWGHYSPASQIRVRLFSWVAEADPNSDAFWGNRLKRALAGRAALLASPDTTACRLIHAESDGVPGLIVDRYNEVLVLQCLTAGAEVRKQQFATLLGELCTGRPWEIPVKSIFERSEADVRDKEGLAPRIGRIQGGEPPEYVDIVENGLHFYVDV